MRNTLNLSKTTIFFIVSYLASMGLFIYWLDFVDPPFISNPVYDFFIWQFVPVPTLVLTLWAYWYCYKRFKVGKSFGREINYEMEEDSKLVNCFKIVFIPVFIYTYFWSLICIPIQLWSFNAESHPWSREFILSDVYSCDYDYGDECIKLKLEDITMTKYHELRWYEDKTQLEQLKGNLLTLTGKQNHFGAIVDTISW